MAARRKPAEQPEPQPSKPTATEVFDMIENYTRAIAALREAQEVVSAVRAELAEMLSRMGMNGYVP